MIFLNPAALVALAAIAAPILIHILIQRQAERFPFPTLRFLQPTRLAAIRRHLLDDLPLLAVRIALLAAAAAALAGPLLITDARRQAWDRRLVRETVTDSETTTLSDGIQRAVATLETAPRARREIVVSSALPIGSITEADVAAIPAAIGVRFERTGTLPATRTVAAGRLLTSGGVLAREVTLAGDRTSVRDAAVPSTGLGAGADAVAWPIDVVTSKADQPAVEAAIATVRSQRVWAGVADRRARLFVADVAQHSPKPVGEGGKAAPADAMPIRQPWIASAVARIAGDRDLNAAAARVSAGLAAATFRAAPWQTLAAAADGRPLAVAAAAANGLLVASAAPASDIATPLLLRAIANAIADVPDLQRAEVLPIADAVLRRWSRPAPPLTTPRIDTVDQDDRRWLWLAVLGLLALETWLRRVRPAEVERREEDTRVA